MVTRESETFSEKEQRLRDEIEKRTGKTPEQLYEERDKRLRATFQLKEPDRVPVVTGGGYFAARYGGGAFATVYYDFPAYKEALKKTMLDLDPDVYQGAAVSGAGPALEALDSKQTLWPGGPLPPNVCHQFVEGEYMKEDEYDLFLSDPTDFTVRYMLPRVYGALAPLAKLPPLRNLSGMGFTAVTPLFATEEFRRAAEALYKAGQEQEKWRKAGGTLEAEMARLGYPPTYQAAGFGGAPFDAISDFYRGMRGSMLDIFRRPDKLLQACDKILEWRVARAAPADPKLKGVARVSMPLHRGAEGFMSREQFEKFYWPGLKKTILASIDLGYVPVPFIEGRFDARLEYLLELPKGKFGCRFEHTDMARAKAILGDHCCIMGNVPSPLLQVGSPSEVEDYCKKLIKDCAKGGGFVLTSGSSIDEAKFENLKAMVDTAKKYGAY